MLTIQPSATVTMSARALAKKARGERVYNLSAGEAIVPVHPAIREAVVRAIHDGKTLYPPVAGIPELRDEVARWMNARYGADYARENVLVTCGGKFGIYAACQALLSHGDEALIIAPYWVSYPGIVRLFGGCPVIVPTQQKRSWKVAADDLEKAITPRTKILFLNNAANPTGVLYSHEELVAILTIAKHHNLTVISDEVYSGLVYDKKQFVSCSSFPAHRTAMIVIQSCSKHFAMTGLRVGFVLAEKPMIDILAIIQGQSTTGTASTSQWAALAALRHDEEIISSVRDVLQQRRDVLVSELSRAFSQKFAAPESGLYLFPSLLEFGVSDTPSLEFCEELLEKKNIATVPGVAFGQEGHIRLSFGETEEELRLAVRQLSI